MVRQYLHYFRKCVLQVVNWIASLLQGDDAEIAEAERSGDNNENRREDERDEGEKEKDTEKKEIQEGKMENGMEKDDSQPEKGLYYLVHLVVLF